MLQRRDVLEIFKSDQDQGWSLREGFIQHEVNDVSKGLQETLY